MEYKKILEKTEEFAKEVVNLAVEKGITVSEFGSALDTAKIMAANSLVDKDCVEKTELPSKCEISKLPFYNLFK